MGYVGAILRYKYGKMLFQLRDENGRNPFRWGLFGGGIEKGESPEKALQRELKEELEITITSKDILKHHWVPPSRHIYEVALQKKPKKSQLHEGKRMKLMSREEYFKEKKALKRVKLLMLLYNIR